MRFKPPKIVGANVGAPTRMKLSSPLQSPVQSEIQAAKDKKNPDKILTYPTVGATIFDVPEPSSIDGKFTYNYFLSDERGSRDTVGSEESFNKHGKKNARFIKLTFSKLENIVTMGTDENALQLSFEEKRRILQTFYEKIDSELDYTGRNFSAITLQDPKATSQLQMAIEAGLQLKKVNTAKLSPLETVLKFNSSTTDKLDGQKVLNNTNIEGNNEYTYIDPSTGKPFEVQQEGAIGKLSINCFLNNKFVADILKNSETAPMSPLFGIYFYNFRTSKRNTK